MRRALDLLYLGSGLLAGFFLVAIALLTAVQIVGREIGLPASSYDDFAGFSLAATSFLGLAWTFRSNDHIRMTLLLHHVRGRMRRALELVSLASAAFLVGTFAWYACAMTITSYQINDVSQGLVAVPLWIPQTGMALGLAILALAIVDDLFALLRGGQTSYERAAAERPSAAPRFER
ncbi:MAG TPA: TRAP transporter small permease [Burkholderiales bacterium]|nr:TRAP transporter small permease [Burkholderiales bacterium]